MKTRTNIYLTLGIVLIVVNLLVDIAEFGHLIEQLKANAYSIGYLFGSHLFLVIGLFLLRWAYKLQRKIEAKQTREMIDGIGKPQV